MSISDRKAKTREAAYAARKTAFRQGHDQAANQYLLAAIALYPEAQVISAYMPIRTEVSPIATMTILHGQDKRICVPVIVGKDLPLMFQEWTPETEMQKGPFGAAVPVKGAFLEPDLLITPLLSFDRRGYRLGYGGGFYDRSFEQLAAQKTVVGIGFAYGVQEVAKVPTEPTDHKLDMVVTEAEVIRI